MINDTQLKRREYDKVYNMTRDVENPLVTVIITCYNYGNYVKEAIDSVLQQTYKNINLLIINDGSTDNSLQVINKYRREERVKIVSRKNRGIVYTRNEGLDLANGEYICFLDADDFFNGDYIEKMVAVAEEYSSDVVYPNWCVFGDEEYKKEFSEFSLQRLITQEIHCTSESLIRRLSIEGHKFESEKIAEDWDFFLGMALSDKKFNLAKDCYINYRVRKHTRATASPYWDNMYYFVEILEKWSKKYPDKIRPLDLPVHAGRIRDKHIASQDSIIRYKEKLIEDQDKLIVRLDGDLRNKKNEIKNITNSKSYRLSRVLAYPVVVSRKLKSKINNVLRRHREDKQIAKEYGVQMNWIGMGASGSNNVTFAVVVHLFYFDNWPLFNKKLKLLEKNSFDLFITMPRQNEEFAEIIKRDYPEVKIIYSPNRGRDILPFLMVAKVLYENGYKTVLKFHSKKSTHWDGGQSWLEGMLSQIIPNNKRTLKQILNTVSKENFGVLGPADVYYPLTINFPANGKHMTNIISNIKSRRVARRVLQEDRKKYGFFGGTMFWISLDSIQELFRYSSASYFEPEAGQIDGTFAHALERLFCVIPEIEAKDIYESTGDKVVKRTYASNNIPSWSEDHDK